MDLDDYKKYYVIDEGHWYLSKVKQYNSSGINLMAKGLYIFSRLLVGNPDIKIKEQFEKFKPKPALQLFEYKSDLIPIDEYSKLYLSLQILQNDLVDLTHVSTTNAAKFKIFEQLQKEFLEGKDYRYFLKKYSKKWLETEFTVYYRNFETWLSKFGFYGRNINNTAYITEIGYEFLKGRNDEEITSAIFLNQVKKIQVWNPTLIDKYKDFQVKPYYLILQILLKLPGNYFTKDEYVLFITKIKSHNNADINNALNLIKAFRKMNDGQKIKYIDSIEKIDLKNYPKRERTNYARLSDSYNKEIGAYAFSNLTIKEEGKIALSNKKDAEIEVREFLKSPRYIIFQTKYDWVRHLGKLNGLSIDDIVEIYVRSGKSPEVIKDILKNTEEPQLVEKIQDRLIEKEIEEYYESHLDKIDKDLQIVREPEYGRQYPTHVGPIDILCINIKTGEYVVLEFKRSQVSDDTIGQILRYMGWVYINLSPTEKKVKGIIIGNDHTEKLHYSFVGVQSEHIYELIKLFEHPFTENNRPILQSLLNKTSKNVRNRKR